jgi:hypothetical protein
VLSRKGDRVAFTRDVDPCARDPGSTCPATLDLLTANPDGTGERLVLSGGTETSFLAPDGRPTASGSPSRQRPSRAAGCGGSRWSTPAGPASQPGPARRDGTLSPDGKQIAYTRSGELWLLDVGTGATRAVTSGVMKQVVAERSIPI